MSKHSSRMDCGQDGLLFLPLLAENGDARNLAKIVILIFVYYRVPQSF
jgi:hypothetical protein